MEEGKKIALIKERHGEDRGVETVNYPYGDVNSGEDWQPVFPLITTRCHPSVSARIFSATWVSNVKGSCCISSQTELLGPDGGKN